MPVEGLKGIYNIPLVKEKIEVKKRDKRREEKRKKREDELPDKDRPNRRLDLRA